MAIRYYYGNTGNLSTVGNWYTNNPPTTLLGSTPSSSDDVLILSNVTDTSTTVTYNTLSAKNVTISNNGLSNSITVTTAYFSGTATNNFSINATNVYFYNYSINTGTLNAAVVFNDWSYNGSGGTYTNATFNSITKKGINSSFLMF